MTELPLLLTDADNNERRAMVADLMGDQPSGLLLALHLSVDLNREVGKEAEAIRRGITVAGLLFDEPEWTEDEEFVDVLAALVEPHVDALLHERFVEMTPPP